MLGLWFAPGHTQLGNEDRYHQFAYGRSILGVELDGLSIAYRP